NLFACNFVIIAVFEIQARNGLGVFIRFICVWSKYRNNSLLSFSFKKNKKQTTNKYGIIRPFLVFIQKYHSQGRNIDRFSGFIITVEVNRAAVIDVSQYIFGVFRIIFGMQNKIVGKSFFETMDKDGTFSEINFDKIRQGIRHLECIPINLGFA